VKRPVLLFIEFERQPLPRPVLIAQAQFFSRGDFATKRACFGKQKSAWLPSQAVSCGLVYPVASCHSEAALHAAHAPKLHLLALGIHMGHAFHDSRRLAASEDMAHSDFKFASEWPQLCCCVRLSVFQKSFVGGCFLL
jgi:hypothetical protein